MDHLTSKLAVFPTGFHNNLRTLRFSQSRPFLLDHLFWLDGKVTSGKYLLEMLIY